ncbi:MAG: Uma2 family endonuclease [Polyangiaceae bacterium]
MVQPARQYFEFADYVALEERSTVKHEYLRGLVWAMAGGSPDHARIATNISTALGNQLAGKRCAVFGSDLRVRVKATGLGTYPDVTVVCGALDLDPEDPKRHTIVNPRVVVEVLSPSTEEYDRGEKLEHYRQVPSLEVVLLVAQAETRIEVHRRAGDRWVSESATTGGVVELAAIGCRLDVDAVYRDPLGS